MTGNHFSLAYWLLYSIQAYKSSTCNVSSIPKVIFSSHLYKMTTLTILVCLGILGTAMASPTPSQKHSQPLPTGASKADEAACHLLGVPVGGNGGEEFADPCDENTRIDEIEIVTGHFDGLANCLLYIKTIYRYIVTKSSIVSVYDLCSFIQ